jgi:hypothetical protein
MRQRNDFERLRSWSCRSSLTINTCSCSSSVMDGFMSAFELTNAASVCNTVGIDPGVEIEYARAARSISELYSGSFVQYQPSACSCAAWRWSSRARLTSALVTLASTFSRSQIHSTSSGSTALSPVSMRLILDWLIETSSASCRPVRAASFRSLLMSLPNSR